MKLMNNIQQCRNIVAVLILAALFMASTGCSVDDGTVTNDVPLPLDSNLSLFCENVGINDEQCILEDPENPYAKVIVNDVTKFELNDDAPSAKARFYIWATALARSQSGENQYYTAVSLHEVFAESASPVIREQAKRAYRSVLDNFFLSSTFFVVSLPSGDVTFAAAIKDLVGQNLYNPTSASLVSLYTDPIFALSDISEWGYIYDTTNEVMNKRS